MNWAKGGAKTGRGGSFKSTLNYVLHDKGADTTERVGEIEMRNLASDDPRRAWREMETAVEAVSAIKARNGIPQTGQKNLRPVYALSLSWHPDDKPDAAHMMQTARKVIDVLGMQDHQAIIVRHTDRPHAHVHICVNLVHPETGKTASLSHDARKLDKWAHDYEAGRQVIRSFDRAAKFERIAKMREAPKPAKDEFALAVAGKTKELRAANEEKKTGLSAKHEEAAKGRKEERDAAWKQYREKRAEITERYQPILEKVRKPRAPALELAPPSLGGLSQWKIIARAMLQQGMFKSRQPLNQTFTRSLSKIAPGQRLSFLAEKFHIVREGKDVMLPIRNTEGMRRYAEKNRTPTREQREKEIKFARNVELAGASVEFEQKKLSLTAEHKKQVAAEKAEKIILAAEIKRAWADYRKENGLPERQSDWNDQRKKNKVAFNEPAKDKPKDKSKVVTEKTNEPWQVGSVGDHTFRAKLSNEPSLLGVRYGTILALEVSNEKGDIVAKFDGGWEQKPELFSEARSTVDRIYEHYKEQEIPPLAKEPEKSSELSTDDMMRTFLEAARQEQEMGR